MRATRVTALRFLAGLSSTLAVAPRRAVRAAPRAPASAFAGPRLLSTSALLGRPAAATTPRAAALAPRRALATSGAFADLDLHPNSKRAVAEVMQYSEMTEVQAKAIPVCLAGGDVVARAKTGTGKTLGFALPAIDALLRTPPDKRGGCSVLIVSPTRELAKQSAAECEKLASFSAFGVQTIYGGNKKGAEATRMFGKRRVPADVVVATPGRLIDHMENTPGAMSLFADLKVLVLDEADQLLEMGFQPDMKRINRLLPDKATRQTLLFSATMPPKVREFVTLVAKPTYEYVDCVGEDETDQTHAAVTQEVAVVPLDAQLAAVYAHVTALVAADPEAKVVVFFTTARLTGYYAELFNALGTKVLEIHSRKSTSAREKASKIFANMKGGVLFTSDVSARGMDYPDVTDVVQVGMTDREQYTHRLGRTARAGKSGKGLLFLAPFEERSMHKALAGMPLVPQAAALDGGKALDPTAVTAALKEDGMLALAAERAYGAWLGYYNGQRTKIGWTKEDLVDTANGYALAIGLKQPPALEARTVGKMGMKGVQGLRIQGRGGVPAGPPRPSRGGGGGGGYQGGGGGGGARKPRSPDGARRAGPGGGGGGAQRRVGPPRGDRDGPPRRNGDGPPRGRNDGPRGRDGPPRRNGEPGRRFDGPDRRSFDGPDRRSFDGPDRRDNRRRDDGAARRPAPPRAPSRPAAPRSTGGSKGGGFADFADAYDGE